MRKSKRLDRQIDDLLFTATTTLGVIYARRRIRRAVPKVLVGAGVLAAAGTVAAGAVAVGTLGIGSAAAVRYRKRSKAAAAPEAWQAPPAAPSSSFVHTHPSENAPIAT